MGPIRAAIKATTPDEAVAQALAPARAFLDAHARPPRGRVIVALLPEVVPEGSGLAAALGDTRGLTLTERLDPALLEHLGGTPFDPVVFVSWTELRQIQPGTFRHTVAHELGHALGLDHRTERGHLMNPEPPQCVPWLDR